MSSNGEVSSEKVTEIHNKIYREPVEKVHLQSICKVEFEKKLKESMEQENLEEELLYLFYNLDREKKGYLSPEDIMGMFVAIEKKITINEIENSFKYAKIYKNKMTF